MEDGCDGTSTDSTGEYLRRATTASRSRSTVVPETLSTVSIVHGGLSLLHEHGRHRSSSSSNMGRVEADYHWSDQSDV